MPGESSTPSSSSVMPKHLPIEVDPDIIAAASDYDGSSAASSFTSSASLRSSILRYRVENGRTYHAYKDGSYLGPNDDPEKERLELQHTLCVLTFDELYLCPAGKVAGQPPLRRILDLGTGTGCWALEVAHQFPEARVVGVDLSPIQPPYVPANVEFGIDDLEDPWTYSDRFSLIYARFLTASVADWPRLFKQCYDNLEPGGWLEVVDILPITSDDGTLAADTPLARWAALILEGTRRFGRPLDAPLAYRKGIEDAGFRDVVEERFIWPQNRWPKDSKLKELGQWCFENIDTGLEAISNAIFTRFLGWTKEDLDAFLAEVREDMKNHDIHSYWPIVVYYAQKPLEDGSKPHTNGNGA